MSDGACRCLCNRRRQRRGMTLRNNHSGNAASFRRANHCAEIVRVFNAVQNDHAGQLRLEHALYRRVRRLTCNRDDALMHNAAGKFIENDAVFPANGHAAFAREIQNFLQARKLRITQNMNPFDRLPPGSQRLVNGMNSADHSREMSATAWAAIASSVPISPTPSIVFALTKIFSTGIPAAEDIASLIDGKYGSSFGFSARMLVSMFSI